MSRFLAALLVAGLAPLAFAGPPAIGLVWWPGDPADPRYEIGREVEACLADTLRAEVPGLRLVTHQAIRDALFPRLEPATQPPDEAAFAALLAREDVRARLRGLGFGHLVAFSGGTRYEQFQGAILCGAGYGGGGCLGFAWQDQNTRLHAALWDLEHSRRIAAFSPFISSNDLMGFLLLLNERKPETPKPITLTPVLAANPSFSFRK